MVHAMKWAVRRVRDITLETITPLGDDPAVGLCRLSPAEHWLGPYRRFRWPRRSDTTPRDPIRLGPARSLAHSGNAAHIAGGPFASGGGLIQRIRPISTKRGKCPRKE
jgi:hypothetical protein